MFYQKELKNQQWSNQEMATTHKVKTNEMLRDVDVHVNDEKRESDEEIDHKKLEIEYEQDPLAISILNKVSEFRLGQTLDDVKGNAQILSGIAVPPTQQQAITVRYIPGTQLFVPERKELKDQHIGQEEWEKERDRRTEELSKFEWKDIDKYTHVASFKLY
jgi:hypothetical protein